MKKEQLIKEILAMYDAIGTDAARKEKIIVGFLTLADLKKTHARLVAQIKIVK